MITAINLYSGVKFNKNKNAMDVCDCDNGVNYSLKIKNMAPDHSFPRWTVVDLNSGKALASLSGGGSYGWIIHSFKGGRIGGRMKNSVWLQWRL